MNTGVKIKQLKTIFFTDKPEQEVISLYHKIKIELYNWADDSIETVVGEMRSVLKCEVVAA